MDGVIISVAIFDMWNDKFHSQAIQLPAPKGATKYRGGNMRHGALHRSLIQSCPDPFQVDEYWIH